MHNMRLDKYLADSGLDTRSNCKNYIKQGRVFVNGTMVKDGSFHVKDDDLVTFDKRVVQLQTNLYYMFHKPSGYICATQDDNHKIVLEYFPKELRKKLLIVGRLDKDTEGLLFITDDGAFVHHLMSPKKHVDKTYYFQAKGTLCDDAILKVSGGIDIGDDKLTLPAELKIITKTSDITEGYLTISEGRYHQVKRMIHVLGAEVTYLKRVSIGAVLLDETLELGQYRELSAKELELLHYVKQSK